MHSVSLPFFTPALRAREAPDTVLDTGTAVERRKTRAFFLPSWSFRCGGRGIPESCSVTAVVHSRDAGAVRNCKAL